MNGIDPSDLDDPPEGSPAHILKTLFKPEPKPQAKEDAAKKLCAFIARSGRYGWTWEPFVPDTTGDESWFNALRPYMVRPAETSLPFLTPTWVGAPVKALMAKYRINGFGPNGGESTKTGKIRTPFLAMVLSWVAAGGREADERAKSVASVIALASSRADVETRVNHFINETW